jgi:hypothetical protein
MQTHGSRWRKDNQTRDARTTRRMTMKTTFLTLAAVLGLALGTASMIPAAHASNVQLYPPSSVGGNG